MRTPSQAAAAAIATARAGTYVGVGLCDHVVGTYYGLAHSGFQTAYQHAMSVPSRYRHPWSSAPPSGGLLFWAGGSRGAGHAALGVAGRAATTDLVRSGRVDIVPVGDIQEHWGLRPLFWTDAWYGSQGVQIVHPAAVTPRCSLANVIAAAKHDAPAAGSPKLHPVDTLLVERALVAEHLLDSKYCDGSFGTSTIQAYSAWQQRLGYRGADANGIPGQTSLTALGRKHGFVVAP